MYFPPQKGARIVAFGIACILAIALVFALSREPEHAPAPPEVEETIPEAVEPEHEVIGASVEGRVIDAYRFGTGDTELLFVGGIHGGYEWNSVVLAYTMIDYFTAHPDAIPASHTVRIIPSLNPDGVFRVTGRDGKFAAQDVPAGADITLGRFNARDVDLNRNFDCKWQPESMWRGNVVSAGASAFSEPEAVALRDYVTVHTPDGVVFWHSQANAVYASECTAGILPGTRTLMNTYAQAAGYAAVDTFDAYAVTGDAEGWLASIGIPAITVELETRTDIEWDKNLAAVLALLAGGE